jgi:hypothetical protein
MDYCSKWNNMSKVFLLAGVTSSRGFDERLAGKQGRHDG